MLGSMAMPVYLDHVRQIENGDGEQWPLENGPYTVQDYINGSWS